MNFTLNRIHIERLTYLTHVKEVGILVRAFSHVKHKFVPSFVAWKMQA